MVRVKLSIGDWSKDGHNQCEYFVYEVNKSVSAIRQSYKDSCKLTGLQFNAGENYTGLTAHSTYGSLLHICTEYTDNALSTNAKERLSNNGIDVSKCFDEDEEDCCIDVAAFAELILQFIKLSIPDFVWEEAAFKKSELENIEPINGWWNAELNVQFGYGLFD